MRNWDSILNNDVLGNEKALTQEQCNEEID
jgi:hypothetical protein